MSFLQALASSAFTLCLAFPAAWGLLALKKRVSEKVFLALEFFILVPSFLPTLMVMVSFLVLLPFFPFGFWGVVAMHALIELGLVTVFLSRWLEVKLRPYEPLFALYPKSLLRQWLLLWPLMKRELFMVFGFLIVFFVTSISVPMIMSGADRSVSLEYLIYTHLKNKADWNTSLHFYLLQMGFIVLCLRFLPQHETLQETEETAPSQGLQKGLWAAALAFLPMTLCFSGLLLNVFNGWRAMEQEPVEFQNAMVGSLLLAFLASGFVFVFLTVLSFFYQRATTRKHFQFWTIPSAVIVGFYWQHVFLNSAFLNLCALAIICAFLFTPTLAKLGIYQQIEKLHSQIEMAEFLGASPFKIFSRITFPMILPWLALAMGLTSLWTMGDFAISRLFIRGDVTLALKMQSLVEQYRWDHALYLSWFLLLLSSLVFLFFGGLAFVAYKKLK